MFISLLAQTPAPSSPGAGLVSFLPFILIFVAMYYVMIRPQQKRAREQARLISALKTGDRVVTAAGIHGLIANVKERTIILKVADNVKIEMEKSAVSNVVTGDAAK